MNVLLVGSGGREHALAWKIAQSPLAATLYVAPGNGGTADIAHNVHIESDDSESLVRFAVERDIGLVVVGPEAPLAGGLVDRCQSAGLAAFGPTSQAARLESSKAFAKAFMVAHGIPAAQSRTFRALEPALDYVLENPGPLVVKASGLAAGKGVIVCDNADDVRAALNSMFVDRAFGAAANEVVLEERLEGPELSLLAFCDGHTAVPMLPARDHKRAYDGDAGPNTGGMGAYAPVPGIDAALVQQIMTEVVMPAIEGMAAAGTPYCGVLYAGLMLTAAGPKVLEFNCRFGDPETQAILPLLEGDLIEIMLACTAGNLRPEMVRMRDGACATIVMAAPGYPGPYPKGLAIRGIKTIDDRQTIVFHAGTIYEDGVLLSSGGRVLAVSGVGSDLAMAVDRAYAGVKQIEFEGAHYRRDIGRSLAGEIANG